MKSSSRRRSSRHAVGVSHGRRWRTHHPSLVTARGAPAGAQNCWPTLSTRHVPVAITSAPSANAIYRDARELASCRNRHRGQIPFVDDSICLDKAARAEGVRSRGNPRVQRRRSGLAQKRRCHSCVQSISSTRMDMMRRKDRGLHRSSRLQGASVTCSPPFPESPSSPVTRHRSGRDRRVGAFCAPCSSTFDGSRLDHFSDSAASRTR